ncbi:MAG: PEP-CTERM sorting domain-containing protein [Verrucomicrobia bacterium]|nr:PEP-CTERM sorting domain-containing protein [Verrucomicrobiota bacterium]
MSIADLGLGSTFIDASTYTASQLNSFFGGFNFSGIGSVTVVPEPQSLLLIGAGLLVLIVRRRNRASI